MSDKHATKQRRAAQNKREREARAVRVARARSDSGGGAGAKPSAASKAPARSGRDTGTSRADKAASRRDRWRDADSPNPGARAVMLGFLMAIGAAAMLFFLPVTPAERLEDGKVVIETTSLLEELGALNSLIVLAVPVLISGTAWYATRWPDRRRRVYVVAAAMEVLWVVLSAGGPGLLFTVSSIALALGAWQALQAEKLRNEENTDGEWPIDS